MNPLFSISEAWAAIVVAKAPAKCNNQKIKKNKNKNAKRRK